MDQKITLHKSGESEYYFRQFYRYGREGCYTDVSSPKLTVQGTVDEKVEQLAHLYKETFMAYETEQLRSKWRLWDEQRKMIIKCDGDMVKFMRYYPEPVWVIPAKLFSDIKSRL